ncbi:MAG: hypothetical protein JJU03_04515 [Idiomarina sp.]|nr:hypothetical protein [Idiomarina sp.]
MRHCYQIYGVVLASELTWQAPKRIADTPADITISAAPVAESMPEELAQVAAYAAIGATQFWLDVPGIARFYAPDVNTLLVDIYADADMESVELYLLGSVLGPLLNMRKLLVIHGNVVHVTHKNQVFRLLLCGPSAAGKSSFAAYLLTHYDAKLVADDLAVFNSDGKVLPGSARLKIWQDVAKALQLNEAELTPIRSQVAKFDWLIGDRFLPAKDKIDIVVLLGSDNEDDIGLKEVLGAQKLLPLQHQIFRKPFANKAGLEKMQFMQVAKYFGATPVVRLYRPRNNSITANLNSMCDVLFAHLLAARAEAVNE